MVSFSYIGSGPYCYSNSFAMMMGASAPSTAVIEFATGSPFGMQLVDGSLPFFDPYGWTPEAGFDDALSVLGWESNAMKGQDAGHALACLRDALQRGPVWVGPVEMGHLRHQPGKTGPIGADHYVVVLEVSDTQVLMHDPEGYPYASLPIADFMNAWRADSLDYGDAYTMRTDFRRVRQVAEEDVLRAAIPIALHWLSMRGNAHLTPRTIGNGHAAEQLASRIERGCSDGLRDHLIQFAVRVGARRANDASLCLERIGLTEAAKISSTQARLIGSLQYRLVGGDDKGAAEALRRLAPTYEALTHLLQ